LARALAVGAAQRRARKNSRNIAPASLSPIPA
jgi:hypothetical protein